MSSMRSAAELSATYERSVPQFVEKNVKIHTHQRGYIGRW